MIRYALKCSHEHSFESWFQSATAFDRLDEAGHLACPICGDTEVVKSLMAPQVHAAKAAPAAPTGQLQTPASGPEAALAAFRRHVEKNAEYVGGNFATEARRIHDGDTPVRAIWGEAGHKEAVALIEDGVPIAPLPFVPTRKTN